MAGWFPLVFLIMEREIIPIRTDIYLRYGFSFSVHSASPNTFEKFQKISTARETHWSHLTLLYNIPKLPAWYSRGNLSEILPVYWFGGNIQGAHGTVFFRIIRSLSQWLLYNILSLISKSMWYEECRDKSRNSLLHHHSYWHTEEICASQPHIFRF